MYALTLDKTMKKYLVAGTGLLTLMISVSALTRADCRDIYNQKIIDYAGTPDSFPPRFSDLVVSKNGTLFYVTAYHDNILSVIAADAEGNLNLVQEVSGPDHALNGAEAMAMDSREQFLWVAAFGSDALSRYPIMSNGSLATPVIFRDNTRLNGNGATQSLDGAGSLVLTEQYLYVGANNAISFYRLGENGLPVDLQVTDHFADTRRLPGINTLAITPDHQCLIAGSRYDGSLTTFGINEQGSLLWQQYYKPKGHSIQLSGVRQITINNQGNLLYVALLTGHGIQSYRIEDHCVLHPLHRVDRYNLALTVNQIKRMYATAISNDDKYLYAGSLKGQTLTLFRALPDGNMLMVKVLYSGRKIRKLALSPDNSKLYILANDALETYDINHSFEFLGPDGQSLPVRLFDDDGNMLNSFDLELSNRGSAFTWFLSTGASHEVPLEPPGNNGCDADYGVVQISLPVADWQPWPESYQLVVAPLHNENNSTSFFIAGRGTGESDNEHYFVIATGDNEEASTEAGHSQGCHDIIGQLFPGDVEGTFTRAHILGQSVAVNQVSGSFPWSVHCVRDGNHGFLLTADTKLNLELLNHQRDQQAVNMLLFSYFRPGDKRLLWYGVNKQPEEPLHDTPDHPGIAVPTAIVLEQEVLP